MTQIDERVGDRRFTEAAANVERCRTRLRLATMVLRDLLNERTGGEWDAAEGQSPFGDLVGNVIELRAKK